MSFWSTEKLKAKLNSSVISPYEESNIKYGAYELSLGEEYYTTNGGEKIKKKLDAGQQLSISPGQFALLSTNEVINIPANNLCFISIKAGIKFRGLVNVSGFHVDPGFKGRLKFSVYNAGSQSINVTQGKPLFMIWFAEFDNATQDIYKGKNGGDEAITSEDVMKITGDVPSPAQLYDSLKEITRRLDGIDNKKKINSEFKRNLIVTIVGGLFLLLFGKIIATDYNFYWEKKAATPSSKNRIMK